MTQLLQLPDPGSSDKASYCRSQAASFMHRASLARDIALREDYIALAHRWSALARYHESELRAATPA